MLIRHGRSPTREQIADCAGAAIIGAWLYCMIAEFGVFGGLAIVGSDPFRVIDERGACAAWAFGWYSPFRRFAWPAPYHGVSEIIGALLMSVVTAWMHDDGGSLSSAGLPWLCIWAVYRCLPAICELTGAIAWGRLGRRPMIYARMPWRRYSLAHIRAVAAIIHRLPLAEQAEYATKGVRAKTFKTAAAGGGGAVGSFERFYYTGSEFDDLDDVLCVGNDAQRLLEVERLRATATGASDGGPCTAVATTTTPSPSEERRSRKIDRARRRLQRYAAACVEEECQTTEIGVYRDTTMTMYREWRREVAPE